MNWDEVWTDKTNLIIQNLVTVGNYRFKKLSCLGDPRFMGDLMYGSLVDLQEQP